MHGLRPVVLLPVVPALATGEAARRRGAKSHANESKVDGAADLRAAAFFLYFIIKKSVMMTGFLRGRCP